MTRIFSGTSQSKLLSISFLSQLNVPVQSSKILGSSYISEPISQYSSIHQLHPLASLLCLFSITLLVLRQGYFQLQVQYCGMICPQRHRGTTISYLTHKNIMYVGKECNVSRYLLLGIHGLIKCKFILFQKDLTLRLESYKFSSGRRK